MSSIWKDVPISMPPATVLVPDWERGLPTLTVAVNKYSSTGGTGGACAAHCNEATNASREKTRLVARILLDYVVLRRYTACFLLTES